MSTLPRYRQRARLSLGVAVVCALFLVETVVAHRAAPSALSPLIWSILSITGGIALVAHGWFRYKSRQAAD